MFDTEGKYLRHFGGSLPDFSRPDGLAIDRDGNVLVCDTDNFRVQVLTKGGEFVTTLKIADTPRSVHIDQDGRIFVGSGSRVGAVHVFVFAA